MFPKRRVLKLLKQFFTLNSSKTGIQNPFFFCIVATHNYQLSHARHVFDHLGVFLILFGHWVSPRGGGGAHPAQKKSSSHDCFGLTSVDCHQGTCAVVNCIRTQLFYFGEPIVPSTPETLSVHRTGAQPKSDLTFSPLLHTTYQQCLLAMRTAQSTTELRQINGAGNN